MAKRSKKKTGKSITEADFEVEPVDQFVYNAMREYGTHTLENRAIPSVEDGLMPVQRRILWAAKQKGLRSNSAFIKHATLIGETMGYYHPTGDASIYGAGVRLASGTPAALIDGSGSWGTYNTSAASMRYHECRITKLTENVYLDPYYLRAVDYTPNFDGSREEPVVLPAKLPMVLAIEQQGMAVGVTTNIPAFTVESLTKVVQHMCQGKPLTSKYLVKTLEFASVWGGKVISTPKEKLDFIKSGYGPITWECDHAIKDNVIVVSGIPPQFNFDNRLESILKIDGVASAVDQADKKNPVRMVITLKRANDADKKKTIAKVLKVLTNRITYRVNIVRRELDDTTVPSSVKSELVNMSIKEVLEDWLDWRLNVLEDRALREEEKDLKGRLEYQLLIKKAIDHLAIIFELLKKRGIDKKKELAKRLKITEDEAATIWGLTVGRLDRLSMDDVDKEVKGIQAKRKQLRRDLKALGASALRRSGF